MNTESTYNTNNISIETAVKAMGDDNYVIPYIQRDFVWKKDKIEFLFDSILTGYPISALLLCPIDKSIGSDNYYKFPKEISFANNTKFESASINLAKFSILDGQQRLTSIYSSLIKDGKYVAKNRKEYHLYIDLTHPFSMISNVQLENAEEIPQYYIKFLSEKDDFFINDNNDVLMRFSAIYKLLNEKKELKRLAKMNGDNNNDKKEIKKARKTARDITNKLFKDYFDEQFKSREFITKNPDFNIHDSINDFSYETLYICYIRFFFDHVLNCIVLKQKSISKTTPMEIFIRSNKGEPLSYSSFLITRLSSYFENHPNGYNSDAKQRIKIDIINKIKSEVCGGSKRAFNLNEQNILKTLLVINSCRKILKNRPTNMEGLYSDIGFDNIEKINDDVLEFINDSWKTITDTILQTYKLVWDDLELSGCKLSSNYVFIPLVLFFWLMGIDNDSDRRNLTPKTKQEIKWYIVSAQMNTIFSGAADTILTRICRQIHISYNNKFATRNTPSGNAEAVFHDFYTFIKNNKIESTNFTINSDDINDWINNYKKGDRQTYILLSLLYPDEAAPSNNAEVDHMHPKNPKQPYSDRTLKENINGLWNCCLLDKNSYNGKRSNPSKSNMTLIDFYRPEESNGDVKDLLLSKDMVKNIDDAYKNKDDNNNPLGVNKWSDFRANREKNLIDYLTAILISDDCSKMPIKGKRPKLD